MRLNKGKAPLVSKRGKVKAQAKENKLDQYWAMIDELKTNGLTLRRVEESQWILNLAFLYGKQYSFFNTSAHALQLVGNKKGIDRIVDNIIISRFRRQVTDMIKGRPKMSVVPNSTDDMDIQAAKVGDKFLNHFWREGKVSKKNRRLASWIYSTGNGFIGDSWNSSIGPEKVDEKSGDIVYSGDAELSVWSPFEVLVQDDTAADIHKLPELQRMRWKSLRWIASNYDRGSEVTSEQHQQFGLDISRTFNRGTNKLTKFTEGAYVVETFIQPNKEFPKGLFLAAANGVVLLADDYPFRYYPMEHFKDLDMPGAFYGVATTTYALPLQKAWNRTVSNLHQFNNTMAKGKWLVPRNSNLDVAPDDGTGEVVEYTPVMGLKPEHLTLKGLPQSVTDMLNVIKTSINDLYSQHEVSQGTNKSDIRSGEMVSILLEQDAHGVIGTHAIYEESMQAVMTRVLKRVQIGYTAERMIKIQGQSSEFEVMAFKGVDLRGNTDVHVVKQSSLPDSRVVREKQIIDKYEKGLYGDPADPEVRRQVMQMLEDAVVKDIYADTISDETYARYENKLIASGKNTIYLANGYDNHAIHLREHIHYQKSMEHQRLKWENTERFQDVEMAFSEHNKVHQKFLADMEQAQLRKMQLMKGGKK